MDSPTNKDYLRQVFDSIDTDGNGVLDRDEVLTMSTRLGQDMSEQQCDEAMAAMDVDGDGEVPAPLPETQPPPLTPAAADP